MGPTQRLADGRERQFARSDSSERRRGQTVTRLRALVRYPLCAMSNETALSATTEPTIEQLAAEMIAVGCRRVHVLAWRDLDLKRTHVR